jgi:ATP phosphoribosyltransferase regulatory subunit
MNAPMNAPAWLLPEFVEDILPPYAAAFDARRARLLAMLSSYGYDYVQPPLVEFLDALISTSGDDLDLKTFKVIDSLSCRQMGVRADITPQIARIDAHLLNRDGVVRLCYAGPVLHTRPEGMANRREPYQLGAELFGHAGIEADLEILTLLLAAMQACDLAQTRVSVGHVGLFRALARAAGLDAQTEAAVFVALRHKDVPELTACVAGVDAPWRAAFLALTELYGDASVIATARAQLPVILGVTQALDELETLVQGVAGTEIGIDLADLRGYGYHTGVVFAGYVGGQAQAVALGGRYDGAGARFGRSRPATGFSLDLRRVLDVMPEPVAVKAIVAPYSDDVVLLAEIARLRALGERVVMELPGQEAARATSGCDRILIQVGAQWRVQPIH